MRTSLKRLLNLTLVIAMLTTAAAVAAQDDTPPEINVVIDATGAFNTPVDAEEPGPALPGNAYSFEFEAEPGDALSFATMLVQTNDVFFAPDEAGIALFDEDGSPITGDITEQVMLWDAGTEVNEEPGVGVNQAPRQADANTGEVEDGYVLLIEDVMDGFTYPAVADLVAVTIDEADGTFTVTIDNISGESDLPSPLAPGVFVLHQEPAPLFIAGEQDYGYGLEMLAEDGNIAKLTEMLAGQLEEIVMMEDAMPDEPTILKAGEFSDFAPGYSGEGTATLIQDPSGAVTLRFEAFSVTRGPQLHILLSPNANPTSSADLGDYYDLGDIRGARGNANFEVPSDVDVSQYNSVVIYCVPFNVIFTVAPLG